jgi:hypothetical protein
MTLKSYFVIAGLAALPVLGMAPHAAAQTPVPHRMRPRIEINPRPLLYRHCTDWYELQRRPSGTVLYPQMRCWWGRG